MDHESRSNLMLPFESRDGQKFSTIIFFTLLYWVLFLETIGNLHGHIIFVLVRFQFISLVSEYVGTLCMTWSLFLLAVPNYLH